MIWYDSITKWGAQKISGLLGSSRGQISIYTFIDHELIIVSI